MNSPLLRNAIQLALYGGAATASMPVHAAPHTATHAAPYRAGHADLADTAVRAPTPPVLAEPAESIPERMASGRFRGLDRAHVMALIAGATEGSRVDLYLQPIVSLPQRKVRFYEAVARLRTEDGEVLAPEDFLPFAEAGGLMPKIDNLILFRCVQVVRRLAGKNRDIGVFCDISGSTLNDPEFFPQLSDFMEANRALAPLLVFEFKLADWRAMGAREQEALDLHLGFRHRAHVAQCLRYDQAGL